MQCLCGLWEVVVRGQEMMHDVLLHAYLTAPLHSSAFQEEHLGYLQFPGISGAIQKLFTRCQLRAGRRQRTGCVKEPSLWGRKMNFSIGWNRGSFLRPGWIWGYLWILCWAPNEELAENMSSLCVSQALLSVNSCSRAYGQLPVAQTAFAC